MPRWITERRFCFGEMEGGIPQTGVLLACMQISKLFLAFFYVRTKKELDMLEHFFSFIKKVHIQIFLRISIKYI